MRVRPITIRCPRCGSSDVTYSCEPKCCFNHICGDCLTSFQLVTVERGEKLPAAPEIALPDSCAPTAACARCGSLRLGVVEDSDAPGLPVACGDCHALLTVEFAEVGD